MKITIIVLIILSLIAILITGFWGEVSELILPNSAWGLYDRNFFEDLLVEIHGGLIDLLIVGVLLYWFESRRIKKERIEKAEYERRERIEKAESNRRERIEKTKSDLESLKYYYGDDAAIRFYGGFKYLLSLGEENITLPDGNMSGLRIKSLSLSNAKLVAMNFNNSTLTDVNLQNCSLEAAQFKNSKLKHCKFNIVKLARSKFIKAELAAMNFERCDIKNATFKDCNLKSAIFKGVDCTGVSFKGCNLLSANFIGATNVTKEMILESSNYKFIKGLKELNL